MEGTGADCGGSLTGGEVGAAGIGDGELPDGEVEGPGADCGGSPTGGVGATGIGDGAPLGERTGCATGPGEETAGGDGGEREGAEEREHPKALQSTGLDENALH